MPDIQRFRLPDAGEGLTEAEIVTWRVKPGDTIAINDPIVEIETAKSLVELPSPFAGVVTELLVPEGITVDVGTPIIAVDTAPGSGPAPDAGGEVPAASEQPVAPVADGDPTRVQQAPEEGAVEPGMIGGPANAGRTAVLVGYGPRTGPTSRRPRKQPPAAPTTAPAGGSAPLPADQGSLGDQGSSSDHGRRIGRTARPRRDPRVR